MGDPVWSWLTGDRHARFEELSPAFFQVSARQHGALGGAWTTEGRDAAALWSPPKHWKSTFRDIAGLLRPSARLFGGRTITALSVLGQIEKKHPREPHWYLAFIGTDPEMQGRGLGSALLRPVLDRCDREGMPAYLESSKEANVPFYQRHGFEVTDTHDFPDGPRMWLMWRQPQVPEAG